MILRVLTEFLEVYNNKIIVVLLMTIILIILLIGIIFIIPFIVYTLKNPLKKLDDVSNNLTSEWIYVSETEKMVLFSRKCLSSKCDLDSSDLIMKLDWIIESCSKPCNTGEAVKYVVDPNNLSKKFYSKVIYSCNTENCIKSANFGDWIVESKDTSGVVFNRLCMPDNICKLLDPKETIIRKDWLAETPCFPACYDERFGNIYNKSFTFDPTNSKYIYSNEKICNTTPCTKSQYSEWNPVLETEQGIAFERSCTGLLCDFTSDEVSQFVKWDTSENCDTNCDDGKTFKILSSPNDPINKITSKNMYKCNNNPTCDSLVTLSSWSAIEDVSGFTFTRICKSKTPDNACLNLDLSKNPLQVFKPWEINGQCSALCIINENVPQQKKYAIDMNNELRESSQTYPCNQYKCTDLSWQYISENEFSVSFMKKCNSSLCDRTQEGETKIVNWNNVLTCTKACDSGLAYKSCPDPNNPTNKIISKNAYPCNTLTCENIAKFSPWQIYNEDASGILFVRDCISSSDICINIDKSLLELNREWLNKTQCDDICFHGRLSYNRKFMFSPNDDVTIIYRSVKDVCNQNPCDVPEYGLWKVQTETNMGILFVRDCSNNPFCDSPYNLSQNNTVFIPWLDLSGNCSKLCDGGYAYKYLYNLDGNKVYSKQQYVCNTSNCSNYVGFSPWTLTSSTDIDAKFIRACFDDNTGRCNNISNNSLKLDISWNSEPCETSDGYTKYCYKGTADKIFVNKYVIDPNDDYKPLDIRKVVKSTVPFWCNKPRCTTDINQYPIFSTTLEITINTSLNLRSKLVENGWNGYDQLNVNIYIGAGINCTVNSGSSTHLNPETKREIYMFEYPPASNIVIHNRGNIIGSGGKGSSNGNTPGGNGGNAIIINSKNILLTIYNYGVIGGGGGGGVGSNSIQVKIVKPGTQCVTYSDGRFWCALISVIQYGNGGGGGAGKVSFFGNSGAASGTAGIFDFKGSPGQNGSLYYGGNGGIAGNDVLSGTIGGDLGKPGKDQVNGTKGGEPGAAVLIPSLQNIKWNINAPYGEIKIISPLPKEDYIWSW